MKAGTVADHPYPPLTKNYYCEAELVAVLDMTRRDLQRGMGDQKKAQGDRQEL